MVTPIQAFRSSDGQLFENELKCLEHEAVKKLSELQVFNHASALAVVDNIQPVMEVLQPLFAYLEQERFEEQRDVVAS